MHEREFYKEWFANPSWWFEATPKDDEYITQKYSHLLDIDISSDEYSYIEKVIIYDQLPRHVYRHRQDAAAKHVIDFFLHKALDICNHPNIKLNPTNPAQWIFTQLPLRHTYNFNTIITVMNRTWSLPDNYLRDPLIKKFIKATYQRCPLDNIHQQSQITHYPSQNLAEFNPDTIDKFETIYEVFAKNIENFCRRATTYEVAPIHKITLSLSGGVDSMVCSVLLAKMAKYTPSSQFTWNAVFINYMNRETAIEEEEFVKDWCRKLNIDLYVRRITEINRKNCMKYELREIYETYTRNVRYATYKYVGSLSNGNYANNHANVIMGHNNDDCIENILTNITQQRKYDELKGMSPDSTQDGIRFLRPLLDIPKDDIYAFARKYNIAHLPNSTPTWSQRGQIRNAVIPVMEKWDKRIVPGLLKLHDHMTDLHKCLDMVINIMIKNTIIQENGTHKLSLDGIQIPNMTLCWRTYFIRMFNITPSYKSLESMIYRLEHNTNKNKQAINIPLTKSLNIYTDKDNSNIFYIRVNT